MVLLDSVQQIIWVVIIWEVLWKVLMYIGDVGFVWEFQKKFNKR